VSGGGRGGEKLLLIKVTGKVTKEMLARTGTRRGEHGREGNAVHLVTLTGRPPRQELKNPLRVPAALTKPIQRKFTRTSPTSLGPKGS